MWSDTKVGWLMSLSNKSNSTWGDVEDFFDYMKPDGWEDAGVIVESGVWGTMRNAQILPSKGQGFAFYHSSRAKFPVGNPYKRIPRISLIGELLGAECHGNNIEKIEVEIQPELIKAFERNPIVRDEKNKELFERCGLISGVAATFYFVEEKPWGELLALAKQRVELLICTEK